MHNPLKAFKRNMLEYKIYRNSELISSAKGLPNTEQTTAKKFIGFFPDANIQVGDVLCIENSSIKYFIVDIDTSSYQGQIFQIKAYYQTTAPVNSSPSSTVYNINTATNSIIGSQESAIINNSTFSIDDLKQLIELNGSEDKQKLYELTSLLQQSLQNDDFHKSKLSKFSDLVAKHSWLPLAIAQIIAGYLQSS